MNIVDCSKVLKALGCPHITLSYDATPKKLYFGRLSNELQGIARFPYWDGTEWTMLKANEFAAKTGMKAHQLTHGTVDTLALGLELSYLDENDILRGLCPWFE